MNVGNAKRSNVTFPFEVERRAADLEAAQWIRSVKDDDFFVVLETRDHRLLHRAEKGVTARTDILQIDHERIDRFELLRSGLGYRRIIEGVNHQTRARVDLIGEPFL